MKILKLTPTLRDSLIGLPETGMGYQKVKVGLRDGTMLRNKIVTNCDSMIIDEDDKFTVKDILYIDLEKKK